MAVTEWLAGSLDALHCAVDPAQHTLDAVLAKRLRDITDLLVRGVLRKLDAGGRSSSSELNGISE